MTDKSDQSEAQLLGNNHQTMLLSRTHRRLHQMIDAADLTAMDAAFIDEMRGTDAEMETLAQMLQSAADMVREASELIGGVHHNLLRRAQKAQNPRDA